MVKLKLVGYLKTIAGFTTKEYNFTGSKKIRELISFPNFEDRLVILVNEKGANLNTKVSGDDIIKILPVIGGG